MGKEFGEDKLKRDLLVNPSADLKKWITNFAGHPCYIKDDGSIISYHMAETKDGKANPARWSILCPERTKGTKGGAGKRKGHALYRIDSAAPIPPLSARKIETKPYWYNKKTK